MNNHLSETEVECVVTSVALADDRAQHGQHCAECSARVQSAKRDFNETVSLFADHANASSWADSADVSQMVAKAMRHAPSTFSVRAWWTNLAAATTVTLVATFALVLLELPSVLGAFRQIGTLEAWGTSFLRTVELAVPGGWPIVALGGALLLVALAIPTLGLRRLRKMGVPFGTLLCLVVSLAGGLAHAQDHVRESGTSLSPAVGVQFRGIFSDLPSVDLKLVNATQEEAVAQICKAAGIGYVLRGWASRDDSPTLSMHLTAASVEDALMAVLGDRNVEVVRTGTLLIISETRGAQPAPAPSANDAEETQGATRTPQTPAAQTPDVDANRVGDVLLFGENYRLGANEVARSISLFGGNADIEGRVLEDVAVVGGTTNVGGTVEGDLVTTGGSATISGRVDGDVAAVGGNVSIIDQGSVGGDVGAVGGNITGPHKKAQRSTHERKDDDSAFASSKKDHRGWIASTLHTLVNHVMIFLIGLLMIGVAGGRFDQIKRALAAAPVHTLGMGVAGFFATVLVTLVLCVTLIGIPIALCVVILGIVAFIVGLAGVAATIGQILPLPLVRDKPIGQLALGVSVLFLLSIIPLGKILLFGLATAGLGAMYSTRFGSCPYPAYQS